MPEQIFINKINLATLPELFITTVKKMNCHSVTSYFSIVASIFNVIA